MNHATSYAFGAFRLIPSRQVLLHHEAPVRIGCRALDLLTALVERPGELLTKRELMARVWPTTTVEESNLKVHMAALRRVLGEPTAPAAYIATVTGRGYRFVAPVVAATGSPARSAGGLEARAHLVDLPADDETPAHFEAVDYGIVIHGEVTLRIEETTLLLKPGSLMVRRGSGHAWANLSGRPCRMLFVQLVTDDVTPSQALYPSVECASPPDSAASPPSRTSGTSRPQNRTVP